MDLFSAIASERRSLANLLEHLTPDQQETQSLCSEWTVKQVAAHLVMPMEIGMLGFMGALVRHRRGSHDACSDAPTTDPCARCDTLLGIPGVHVEAV